jgi:hypothetical protein
MLGVDIMKKLFVAFLLVYYVVVSEANDVLNTCAPVFSRYYIDISIKTSRGWARVCNNNKLSRYLPNGDYGTGDIDAICGCVLSNSDTNNRSIGALFSLKNKGGMK